MSQVACSFDYSEIVASARLSLLTQQPNSIQGFAGAFGSTFCFESPLGVGESALLADEEQRFFAPHSLNDAQAPSPPPSTRFVVWRVSGRLLELEEQSTQHDLVGNRLVIGPEIFEVRST